MISLPWTTIFLVRSRSHSHGRCWLTASTEFGSPCLVLLQLVLLQYAVSCLREKSSEKSTG
jgi:hypothetical protein